MDNNTVIKLLTDYRSYKFALMNLGVKEIKPEPFMSLNVCDGRRPRFISNWDMSYDKERYSRIIQTLEGAVDFVLSEDQQRIIRMKYMSQNPLTLLEIADHIHRDRKTVGTQHKKAINSLAKALLPISNDYMEINNLDFMLNESA